MQNKRTDLLNSLAKLAPGGLCVAFSGGVDSALLLKAACMAAAPLGAPVHAVTLRTPFHPAAESHAAAAMAAEFGAVYSLIELENMPPAIMQNPPDRCYRCKRTVFEMIKGYAGKNGLAHVLDGTNADDLREYRPGLRALAELGIISPLADLKLTKDQVRAIAADLSLTVAKKPSAPCLATRFPYHSPIDLGSLEKVETIEAHVKALGIAVVRARVQGDTIRLEVLPEWFDTVLRHRDTLLDTVRDAGFQRLALDLAGYTSGSFDAPYRMKDR